METSKRFRIIDINFADLLVNSRKSHVSVIKFRIRVQGCCIRLFYTVNMVIIINLNFHLRLISYNLIYCWNLDSSFEGTAEIAICWSYVDGSFLRESRLIHLFHSSRRKAMSGGKKIFFRI